jgi:hypothetical protein
MVPVFPFGFTVMVLAAGVMVDVTVPEAVAFALSVNVVESTMLAMVAPAGMPVPDMG